MKMFDNFDNTSEGYIPCNIPPKTPEKPMVNTTHSFSTSIPIFNIKDEFLGFEWNYGDSADIPFELDGYILDSEDDVVDMCDYIDSEGAEMVVINWKGEDVLTVDNGDVFEESEGCIIIFNIDNDTSSKLVPGTYHARINVGGIEVHAPFDSLLVVR